VDRSRASAIASVAALASSGEPVLVLSADALWRRALVESAAPPGRFGGGLAAVVAARGSLAAGRAAVERLLAAGGGGLALADWPALALDPGLAARFPHVVLADPAFDPEVEAAALAGAESSGGYVHVLSSHADPSLSLRALSLELPGRAALGHAYRALRQAAAGGPLDPASVRRVLEGSGPVGSPEACGRLVTILAEIGAVRVGASGREGNLEVVSSVRGALEQSPRYVANLMAHEECVRFLTRGKEQSSSPMPAAA
jgi:hypothetical protein